MAEASRIDSRYATEKLRVDYAHVGLYDVTGRKLYIARKSLFSSIDPSRISHAKLLVGGDHEYSVPEKDRFLCFWFNTPNSGDGLVQGYPIEWDEAHLMVRLDPNWDYRNQALLRSTDTARIEANIEQQYKWGQFIFNQYAALKPRFPVSWHLLGPRAADSMFYIQRWEPGRS